jgi:hypothetical protein
MADIVTIRMDWDRTAIPLRLPQFRVVAFGPEPGFPFGRKGAALAGAWRQLATPAAAGMLILDGDVAIDPADVRAMFTAIDPAPDIVHVAPARLWPISTGQPGWVWGHGRGRYTQDDHDDPDVWTFCFTYLPRQLIEACVKTGLETWAYPSVDRRVHQLAAELGVPARTVRGAAPKHLHY